MIKSFDKVIADKMVKGITKESAQIAEIGQVLVAMGKSRTERIYLLSHDEDFIPDVLSCYNHKNQKVRQTWQKELKRLLSLPVWASWSTRLPLRARGY